MEATEQIAQKDASTLAQLVSALPEVYQPIYGHPELTSAVSRTCDDRVEHIVQAWKILSIALGRPARVLDLGCAQGYIAFHLAALGAAVAGIDHCVENITVCQAIAAEHPDFEARFVSAKIECLFDFCDLKNFDMVLGLSVFHHMATVHGHATVAQFLAQIGACVPVCIVELALAQEPVHWAVSQPVDERVFLSGFAFYHELARFPTHLSDVQRPLIFASNVAWYLDGNIDAFQTMTQSSHDAKTPTCDGTRRYFSNELRIAKVFSRRDNFKNLNRQEIMNEAAFLTSPPSDFAPLPQVLSYGMNEGEIWLVRERLPGELLYHMIRDDKVYDAKRVIHDVLKQLVILESNGLYHNDLKTWNVLMRPDHSATLIDYGSIAASQELFSWPCDVFSSFWLFVWCVTKRSKWSGNTHAPPFASPYHLEAPYAQWGQAMMDIPASQWTFALFLEHFESIDENAQQIVEYSAQELWRRNVESYLSDVSNSIVTCYTAVSKAVIVE